MRWLALTFGAPTCASTHFRIHQYVPLLAALGITLECRPATDLCSLTRPQLQAYAGILLQKKLLSWPLRRKLASARVPLIFDTDDATWHPHSRPHHWVTRLRTARRLGAQCQMAARVLTANSWLSEELRQCSTQVEVFPMTLPLADWSAAPPTSARSPVVLGWAGAPHNQFHLQHIAAALRKVKQARPDVVVRVFSGSRPALGLDFDFIPFEASRQVEVLRTFSVGLLPMPDTPFNHGKSPIKALQYMASGIPCVASPLAGSVEMLGHDSGTLYATDSASWTTHLLDLVDHFDTRQQLGQRARARYEAQYTTEEAAKHLARVLQQVARP